MKISNHVLAQALICQCVRDLHLSLQRGAIGGWLRSAAKRRQKVIERCSIDSDGSGVADSEGCELASGYPAPDCGHIHAEFFCGLRLGDQGSSRHRFCSMGWVASQNRALDRVGPLSGLRSQRDLGLAKTLE